MKFIPILFSTPMVQALLEGRKTQTRRTVKLPVYAPWMPEKADDKLTIKGMEIFDGNGEICDTLRNRFGVPGDVLWVRENWHTDWIYDILSPSALDSDVKFYYQADLEKGSEGRLRPSIHMPKAACRIWLKVKGVRVERLGDISEADAIAEGFEEYKNITKGGDMPSVFKCAVDWLICYTSAVKAFRVLWQSINGPESWEANPWVWVVEFERCEMPEGFLDKSKV